MTISTGHPVALLGLVTLLAGVGCSAPEAGAAGAEAETSPAMAGQADVATEPFAPLEGSGPWTARSTGGSVVTLHADQTPLVEGPVSFSVEVKDATGTVTPRSMDFTSPTMPMHGVMRVPVVSTEGGHQARVHVPMGGRWAFYVNLDEGGDNAEFVFEVRNADGSSGHEHHGEGNAMPADAGQMDHDMDHDMDHGGEDGGTIPDAGANGAAATAAHAHQHGGR